MFDLHRLAYGLAYYLIVPAKMTSRLPFATLVPGDTLPPPPYLYLEPVAGILATTPILVALLFVPALARRPTHRAAVVAALVSLAIGTTLSPSPRRACQRYESTSDVLSAAGGARVSAFARLGRPAFVRRRVLRSSSSCCAAAGGLFRCVSASPATRHLGRRTRRSTRGSDAGRRRSNARRSAARASGRESQRGHASAWIRSSWLGGPPTGC